MRFWRKKVEGRGQSAVSVVLCSAIMLLASFILLPETLPAEGSRSFGANVLVNTPVFWDSGAPEIALAPDGVIYVVWDTGHGDESIYFAKSVDGGRSFCCQRRVNDDPVNASQGYPSLAVGPDGSLHVAWSDYRNDLDRRWTHDGGIDGINDDDIYYAKSEDGGDTFLPNVKVNDDVGIRQVTHMHRFIAVDGIGKIHIVWGDHRDGDGEIYYANSTDGGLSFNANVRVSYSGGQEPSLAIDSNGTIFVVWSDYVNETIGVRIFFSKSLDGGISFETPLMIDNSTDHMGTHNPEIAVGGNVIGVVWEASGNPSVDGVYASVSLDGGNSFSQPQHLSDSGIHTAEWCPSISINETGYITTAWNDKRTSDFDIYFSDSNDYGATFGENVRVNDDGTMFYQYMPSVAVDENGHVYIVWYDYRSGTNWEIYFAKSPSGLADLTVTSSDILFSDGDIVPYGTQMTVNVTIWNVGDANASDVLVTFFDGQPDIGESIGTDVIPFIERYGGYGYAEVLWLAVEPQFHDICVLVDPHNEVTESNETNNTACRTIEVIVPPIPASPGNLIAQLSGKGFSNVTLEWSLSPDDGGSVNLTRYDIYRNESHDAERGQYSLIGSVPNGTSEYVDEKAGEGDPDNHYYYVCAIGDMNISSCTLDQAGKFTRPLTSGPSLVSIPLIQFDENIETVLQTVEYDKAWNYNSSSQEWIWHMTSKTYRRGLWDMDLTDGMWVNVTENSNLTVAGVVPAQTTIHLHEGWNLVSFPSFSTTYMVADLKAETGATRVEGYDPSPPNFLRALGDAEGLQVGYGYWVRVEAVADWIVEMS